MFINVYKQNKRTQKEILEVLLLLLLLKPAAQAKASNTKLFINCFRNPTNTCGTENFKKGEGSNQRLTIQSFGVKHNVGKIILRIRTWAGRKNFQIGTFYTLILQTQWMSCSRNSDVSNSGCRSNLIKNTLFIKCQLLERP